MDSVSNTEDDPNGHNSNISITRSPCKDTAGFDLLLGTEKSEDGIEIPDNCGPDCTKDTSEFDEYESKTGDLTPPSAQYDDYRMILFCPLNPEWPPSGGMPPYLQRSSSDSRSKSPRSPSSPSVLSAHSASPSFSLKSSSYNPTSPGYSPTSPNYSPSSSNYAAAISQPREWEPLTSSYSPSTPPSSPNCSTAHSQFSHVYTKPYSTKNRRRNQPPRNVWSFD